MPQPLRRPPASAVPALGARVQIGEIATDGPTWQYASRSLRLAWRRPGGDWLDMDGVPNGPKSHALLSVRGTDPPAVDVTSIVKRLQVDNTGILLHMLDGATPPAFMSRLAATPPRLTVATDEGEFNCPCTANCFVDSTSNQTLGGTAETRTILKPAAMLKFDLGAVRGMLKTASLKLAVDRTYGPATVAIDYLDMPLLVTDPARQLGGARDGIAATVASDRDLARSSDAIFYSECSSEAAIRADWSVSPNYPGGKICINPQFVQWPEVGLTALRMESCSPTNMISPSDGSSILTWRKYPAKGTTYRDLYCRYLMRIDPDVYTGMNEQGVKLPGFEGDGFSYRMEHLGPSVANPNVFRLVMYSYDAVRPFDDPNRGSVDRTTSVCLQAGRLYSIEQHVRLNTVAPGGAANPDGLIEIFVDGVLVYADAAAQVTKTQNGAITIIPFANFFHGGSGVPKAAMHYEFSGIAVSRKYIGPPRKRPTVRSATWPSWRRSMTAGQISTIAGSSMAVLGTNNAMAVDAWNGLAAGDAGEWYSAANGGHADSNDNGVYMIRLADDAPRWKTLRNASRADLIPSLRDAGAGRLQYYRDGRPAARHSYYSPQVIASRNRVMLFYCAAAWGDGNASDPIVDAFRLRDDDWDAQGAWARGLVRNAIAQCVAKHPATEDVYCAMNGDFAKWTQRDGSWSPIRPKPELQMQFCGSLIDAARNRWVFSIGKALRVIDLDTYASGTLALSGVENEAPFGDYNNIVHDTHNDRYVVCCTDGRIFRIDPESGTASKLATLPRSMNGVQNRFAYFEALGGIAYYPEYKSDIFFLAMD